MFGQVILHSTDYYKFEFNVPDGERSTGRTSSIANVATLYVPDWLNEIRQTVGVPDYWEEIKRSERAIAVIRQEDFDNSSLTEDEQRQISAQLQQIKNQLKQFQVPAKQISEVEERLNKLEEESHHLGRKDWLIIFITTLSPLVVGDIVTPGVARYIFAMVINGLIHLFGGGPPQILG